LHRTTKRCGFLMSPGFGKGVDFHSIRGLGWPIVSDDQLIGGGYGVRPTLQPKKGLNDREFSLCGLGLALSQFSIVGQSGRVARPTGVEINRCFGQVSIQRFSKLP
jgi:hypothetical protein